MDDIMDEMRSGGHIGTLSTHMQTWLGDTSLQWTMYGWDDQSDYDKESSEEDALQMALMTLKRVGIKEESDVEEGTAITDQRKDRNADRQIRRGRGMNGEQSTREGAQMLL